MGDLQRREVEEGGDDFGEGEEQEKYAEREVARADGCGFGRLHECGIIVMLRPFAESALCRILAFAAAAVSARACCA